MAVPPLTQGVLPHALAVDNFTNTPIIVQVLDVQHIQPKDGAGPKRTKVTVSDGLYKCTALLATQLKDLVEQGAIVKGSILEVFELVGNKKLQGTAASKKLLIFLNLNVMGNYPEQIGNPANVPDGAPPPMPMGGGPAGPSAAAAAAAGGYGAPPMQQQNGGPPPGAGGMYGGPPQPAGNGMYGGPPPQQQQNGGPGGMYGGPPPQQQQQMYRPPGGGGGGGGGGMYGGPPAGPQYGMGGGHGPVTQSNEPHRIVPISGLNPYLARWTIKARVTQKGDVRRWSNPRSEGKLMSFDLVDKAGGEIRATAWNDQVDQFQDMIQVGRVITISKASLKPRNAKFNTTPHEFEIYLDRGSMLAVVDDHDPDVAAIPRIMFNFKKLAELNSIEAGQTVDVIGVVDSVSAWGLINRKDGSETRKRSLVLRDDSGCSVELTLWDKYTSNPGDQLEQMVGAAQHPVLAVKNARVGDFNGRSLSTLNSSTVLVEPVDRPETNALRAWYDRGGGAGMQVSALSAQGGAGGGGRQDRRVTLGQILDEDLGMHGEAAWVAVVATLTQVNNGDRPLVYPSCTRERNGRLCQKKLQGQEGSWFCETCGTTVEQPAYRYLLNVVCMDHTGQQNLTAFGDTGEAIMGCKADDLADTQAIGEAAYEAMVQQRMNAVYSFKLKCFQDTYNDETRRKISISKLSTVDYVAEGRHLLELIGKLEAGQPIFTAQPAAATAGGRGGNMGMGAPMGGGGGGPAGHYGGGGGGAGYGGGYGGPPQQQQQQQGMGASPYGGGGGGGNWNGGGGGGGYGGPQGGYNAGGGGGSNWNGGGGGGYQQQPPQQQQQQPQYGNQQQQGGWNGGGGGMHGGGGGGNWGGPNQGPPGGFQQGPPQQYNAAPFNAGFA